MTKKVECKKPYAVITEYGALPEDVTLFCNEKRADAQAKKWKKKETDRDREFFVSSVSLDKNVKVVDVK